MKHANVTLSLLKADDREQFILDNQWAFKHGAMMGFADGEEPEEFEGEIISRETIEQAIDAANNAAYRIILDGRKVGGLVVRIDRETNCNHLELLFVDPKEHSKGIGVSAWQALEALYPEAKQWETTTPYFEKRNLHFYVNKCGFHVVEFYHAAHPDPQTGEDFEMFRFVKTME